MSNIPNAQENTETQSHARATLKDIKEAAEAISKLGLKVAREVADGVPYLKVAANLAQAAFEIYEVRHPLHY